MVLLTPLVLYLSTLSPRAYFLDDDELRTAASTLGIAHPPGYPLYVLVGRLFAYLPLGDASYRLDLMSAVFAALTVFLLYRLVLRLTHDRLAAASAALMLAASYYFWANAIAAEVYSLDTFLLAAILLLLVRWRERGETGVLVLATLLLGLSLANRTTSVLYLPAFVLGVASRRQTVSKGLYPLLAVALLAGLLPYVYLPIRYATAPEYVWGTAWYSVDLTGWGGFWWWVSAAPFRSLVFAYGPAEFGGEVWTYLAWLWGSFLGAGVVFGLAGLAHAWRHQRSDALLLALVFIPQAVFYVNYGAVDKAVLFGPTYLVWAVWAGTGLALLSRWLREQAGTGPAYRLSRALLLAPAGLLVWVNLPLMG